MATTRGRYPDLDIIFHGTSPGEDEPIERHVFKSMIDWWTDEVLPGSLVASFHHQSTDQFGEEVWQTTIRTNATQGDVVKLVRRLGHATRTLTVVIASDEVRDRQARWEMLPAQTLEEMDFETGQVV